MKASVTAALLVFKGALALIPVTPGEQTRRAITSTKETITKIKESNLPPRIYIDYLIPLPPETSDADIGMI